MAICNVCFRKCEIEEGKLGFCLARTCRYGNIVPENYGRISSIALDPIEKKPLKNFHPGTNILSVGSYGCNLRCPFCQNYEISYSENVFAVHRNAENITPDELAMLARSMSSKNNIGVAFTYNEPLVGYEFVLATAKKVRAMGMKNVLVTNGSATREVLDELLPYIDAMNIDLKGITDEFYENIGGDRQTVLDFIEHSAKYCHVEITNLIIPEMNDSPEEMTLLAEYIQSLGEKTGKDIPLHVTRFFPRFRMKNTPPTPIDKVYSLADIARGYLKYVYTGNC